MAVRRVLLNTGLVLASLLAGLAVSEVVLRMLLPDFRDYYVHFPNRRLEFDPSSSIMPGISGKVRFYTQSDGIRGDERTPRHTYRILAVGGSTTQCVYLDQAEAWPQRVQTLLNERFAPRHLVWVGNTGRPGRRTREHVLQVDHLLPQLGDIDAVLLLLGANDAMRRLAEDTAYDPHAFDRPGAPEAILRSAFEVLPSDPYRLDLGDTAIAAFVRRLVETSRSRTQQLDRQGAAIQRWRLFRARAPVILRRLPDLGPALEEYARNLERIADAARRHGARAIFVTQPSLYRAEMPAELERLLWMGGIGDYNREPGHPYYSAAALAEAFEAYNRTMLRFCRDRDLECIDAGPRIPKDTRAFYDDVHFNENGAALLAELVVEHLASRPPFSGEGSR